MPKGDIFEAVCIIVSRMLTEYGRYRNKQREYRNQQRELSTSVSTPPSISIRTHSPVEVHAVWSDEVSYSPSLKLSSGAQEDEYIIEQEQETDEVVTVRIPRRCKTFNLQSSSHFRLCGTDKFEVENDISIQAQGRVDLICTLRGLNVTINSEESIESTTLEGVQVTLTDSKEVRSRRLGAKVCQIVAGTDVDIRALYVDKGEINTKHGNVTWFRRMEI